MRNIPVTAANAVKRNLPMQQLCVDGSFSIMQHVDYRTPPQSHSVLFMNEEDAACFFFLLSVYIGGSKYHMSVYVRSPVKRAKRRIVYWNANPGRPLNVCLRNELI